MARTKSTKPTKKPPKKSVIKKVVDEQSLTPSSSVVVKAEREVKVKEQPSRRTTPPSSILKNTGARASGDCLIVNHHTARIVLPRTNAGKITVAPLNLEPGAVTSVKAEEWEAWRKNKVVGYYMDKGIIVEVGPSKVDELIGVQPHTSDLQSKIPEHLQTDDDEIVGKTGIPRAKVKSLTPGHVRI